MKKEFSLEKITRGLFPKRGKHLDNLPLDAKPQPFDETVYFFPFPYKEITDLLKSSKVDIRTNRELTIANRNLLCNLYQAIGSFVFAIVNTDIIREMRRSIKILEDGINEYNERRERYQLVGKDKSSEYSGIVEEAKEILEEAESLIDLLKTSPINRDESEKIYHLSKQYNELIREKVFSKGVDWIEMGEKRRGTLTHYGARYNDQAYRSFEEILNIFESAQAGFNVSYVKGESPYSERKLDHLSLRINTESNVHFSLYPLFTGQIEDLLFDFSQNTELRKVIRPIHLNVRADGKGSVYTPMLRAVYSKLKKLFEYREINIDGKPIAIFCPKYAQLQPGAQLQLN